MTKEIDFEVLRELLKTKTEVTVKFTKVNGDDRIMKCTLNDGIIPQSPETEMRKETVENSESAVIPVWDLEANAWRCFRKDSVYDYSA